MAIAIQKTQSSSKKILFASTYSEEVTKNYSFQIPTFAAELKDFAKLVFAASILLFGAEVVLMQT